MKSLGIPTIYLIIAFFAIMIAASFAVMLIIVNTTIDRDYRSEIAARNGLAARSAARELGSFLDSNFDALAIVAADPRAETLRLVKRSFSSFSEIYIVDRGGRVSLSTGTDPGPGFDASRQDSVRGGDCRIALADAAGTLVAHTEAERVDRSENIAWPESLKDEITREDASWFRRRGSPALGGSPSPPSRSRPCAGSSRGSGTA
jgi:hypothetical protein